MYRKHAQKAISILTASCILLILLGVLFSVTLTKRIQQQQQASTAHHQVAHSRPSAVPQAVSPTNVAVSGTNMGVPNTDYVFTVTAAAGTTPISYTWEATGLPTVLHSNINTLNNLQSFRWLSGGVKTVTVTVSNNYGVATATNMIVISRIPLMSVILSGTTTGDIGNPYTFTANSLPITASQPMTYVWQASSQSPITMTDSLSNSQSFIWTTPGSKMITVTANNQDGAVSATHSIDIGQIPPAQLAISGPTSGLIDTTYPFSTTVTPPTATQPITYIWQAVEHEPMTHTANSAIDTQSLSWETPGSKMITVTALNEGGRISATHLIDLELGGISPITLTLTGTEPIYIGKAHLFTGTVEPLSTTQPLTYTWETTDHLSVTLSSYELTATHAFTWTTLGEKLITLTVNNGYGILTETYPLVVEQVPPQKIVLEGPESTYLGESITLNANIGKSDTSTPLTYTWEATGQETITRTSQALIATRPYTWTIAGPKTITVTVANDSGVVSATHAITVVQPLLKLEMSDSADPVLVGDEYSYLLTVTNDAPITATEVEIFNELPLESAFISMTSSTGFCREENGDITCRLGTLTSTQSVTMSFVVTPTTNGRLTNRAKLTSGITELEVNANIVAEETIVSKPGLGITKVSPAETFNDVPSIVYIEGFGFHQNVTVTLEHRISETLTTTLVSRVGQLFTETENSASLKIEHQDAVEIIANIPAQLQPGTYDIVVSRDDEEARVANAYHVFDASKRNDLRSSSSWMATNPFPMRVESANSGISLTLQYLGYNKIENATVEYRLDSISGTLLGRTDVITDIRPFAKVSTEMISWQPKEEGQYTITAIIDPDNKIAESNEENNVITRTITVLPNPPDITPPDMTDFMIEDTFQIVSNQHVKLDSSANDRDKPVASGIDAIKYIEFEYNLAQRRWEKIGVSDWVDYQLAQKDYPWRLKPTYGMRYMQAWAVDNARNFSLEPSVDVIGLLPTEENPAFVAQHGVVFYRFQLQEGETLNATLTSLDGDADIYVWAANGKVWESNNESQIENISFEAPDEGVYQIEVHGFTDAQYTLQLGGTTNETQRRQTAQDEEAKPVPEAPAVPLDEWPEYYDIKLPPAPYEKHYLPLLMR